MDQIEPRINLQDTFAQMPHKTASYGKYEVCFSSLAGLVHIGHGLVLAVYNLVVPGRHFFPPNYEDALTARHDVRPLQHLKLGMILLIPVIGSIVCWFFYYPTATRERAVQYINLAQYLLGSNNDVLAAGDEDLAVLDNGAFLYEFAIEEYEEAGKGRDVDNCLRQIRSRFVELHDASLNDAQRQQILAVAARHPTLFPEGLGGVNEGQAAPQEGENDVELLSTNINPFLAALDAYRQNPNAQPQPDGGRRDRSHNSLSEKSSSSSSTESDEGRRTPPGNPPPPPSGGSNPPRSFNSNPLSEDEKRRSWDRPSAAGVDGSKRLSSNAALSLLRPNPPIPTPAPLARDASPPPSSSSTSSVLSSSMSGPLSKEIQGISLPRPPSGGTSPTFSLSSSSSALSSSSVSSLLSGESAEPPPPIPAFPSGGFGDLIPPDCLLDEDPITSDELDLLARLNPRKDPRKLVTADTFVAPGNVSPKGLRIPPNPAASVSSVAPSLLLSPSGLGGMDDFSATLSQYSVEPSHEERDNDFRFSVPSGGFSFTNEDDETKSQVAILAVQHRDEGNYAEAAELFEQIGDWSPAADSYSKAGNENKALECALKASTENQPQLEDFSSPEDFSSVEEVDVDQLIEQGKYKDAAQVCVAKEDWKRAGECFELAEEVSQAAVCVARTGDVGLCLAKSEEFIRGSQWSAAKVCAVAAHKRLQEEHVPAQDKQLQQALSRLLECAIAESAAKSNSSALHKVVEGDRAASKSVNSVSGFGVTLRKTELEPKATPTKKERNELEDVRSNLRKVEPKSPATSATTVTVE